MGSLSGTKRRSGDAQDRTDHAAGEKVNHKIQHFGFREFLYSRMQTRPSDLPQSEQRFRDEVRGLTARWTHCVPEQDVVERVNRYVSGWVNYFHLYNSTQVFTRQRFFLEQRRRKYLQKRRQLKGNGIKRCACSLLYPETWLCIVCVLAKVTSFVLKATAVGAIY